MRGDTGSHIIALGFTILTIATLENSAQGAITAILLAAFLVTYSLKNTRRSRPVILLGIGELVALSTGTEGFPLALQLLLLGLILREQHFLAGWQSVGFFAAFSVASVGLVAILQDGGTPLAALPVALAVFGGAFLVVAIVEHQQQKQLIGGA